MAEVKKTEEAEKLVKIRIPRSRKDEGDVYVGINGRSWLIKRGCEVEVPECVAALLRDQEEQLESAYSFSDSASSG